jgi:NADH-quinone oxidoreductase subunit G
MHVPNWVEINRPDLLPYLSTTKSPQQMHGALTKRGSFARSLGPEFAAGKVEPYVVSEPMLRIAVAERV